MSQIWTQRDEEDFVNQLGEHGPYYLLEKRSLEDRLARAEGYLRALDHPRRWDDGMSVSRLRALALKRVEVFESQIRKSLNGSGRSSSSASQAQNR